MKKNDLYKGFRVLDVVPSEENDSTGIFLRHEKSGLEVFHLLNNDRENLFAFAFRTPSQDSTGAAHVLEHSVLCGSEKYNAKDPFLQLSKQSINTYLNAFTASDRTVFPSSSLIKADYFNIMSVYADAVFFPLLRSEVFSQECWRLEHDEKGNPSIQGVVFNEMKGNYSSFNSVAGDVIGEALVPGSVYNLDSGGDPLEIPDLTVQKLKAFHKKYYCTSNCLVFLYGNIPTEEQLDFLNENVIKKVSSYGRKTVIKDVKLGKSRKTFRGIAPAEDDGKTRDSCTLTLTWRLGKNICDSKVNSTEILMLSDLLFGSDSAPVRKALLKKFPKCAVSPLSGPMVVSYYNLFTFALSEMKENLGDEFRKTVFDVLESLAEKGFEKDDIDRALMDFEIRNLEVKRSPSGGPYSIAILRQVLRGWTYGMEPWKFIDLKKRTDEFKAELSSDAKYLQKLIRKYFLDNDEYSLCAIVPSAEYTAARTKKEAALAKQLEKKLGREKIQETLLKMQKFQADENESSVIPSVRVKDLEVVDDGIKVKKSTVGSVPFFTCEEPCNGLIYATISFPVDVLDPEDYLYLPLLEETLTEMGWAGLSWEKTSALADKITGCFNAIIRRASVSDSNKKYMEENPLTVGREWLGIRIKFLEEKTDEVFALLGDCLSGVDFSDSRRLKTIICGAYSGLSTNVVPHAHYYASLRSMRTVSRFCAVNEIMDGITCLETFGRLRKMKCSDIQKKLLSMYGKIRSSGVVINVTADRNGLVAARKASERLVADLGLCGPKKKRKSSLKEFVALTELEGTSSSVKNPVADEVFVIPGDIGFASCAVESSPYGTKAYVEDTVLAHALEKSDLWKKIRMAGGAYGVFMNVNGDMNLTRFVTYRDPKPFESLGVFEDMLRNLESREFTAEETEHSVCGVYADDIEPMTPQTRGGCGIMRVLYGGSGKICNKVTSMLLKTGVNGMKRSAKRYSGAVKKGKTVVFCGRSLIPAKMKEKCGKIIKLKV